MQGLVPYFEGQPLVFKSLFSAVHNKLQEVGTGKLQSGRDSPVSFAGY